MHIIFPCLMTRRERASFSDRRHAAVSAQPCRGWRTDGVDGARVERHVGPLAETQTIGLRRAAPPLRAAQPLRHAAREPRRDEGKGGGGDREVEHEPQQRVVGRDAERETTDERGELHVGAAVAPTEKPGERRGRAPVASLTWRSTAGGPGPTRRTA